MWGKCDRCKKFVESHELKLVAAFLNKITLEQFCNQNERRI
jgi:hypothetical protein